MGNALVNRLVYVNRALMFRDTDLVKVVTGVRRCGKSSLLQIVRQHIEAEGVPGRSFVSANMENRELGIKTDADLYAFCKEAMGEGKPICSLMRSSVLSAGTMWLIPFV